MKSNVLLDLDQTLISAESTDEFDFDKERQRVGKFAFDNMDGYYIIFHRPGLQEFLDFLFANFNVSVWTAATKDYALFVINKILLQDKPERKLDWIFFSYHCGLASNHKNGTKDLSMLWDEYKIPGYTKHNTLIIDDYDEVYHTQPHNCIIAEPFEFAKKHSSHDDYLRRVRKQLERVLDHQKADKQSDKKLAKKAGKEHEEFYIADVVNKKLGLQH